MIEIVYYSEVIGNYGQKKSGKSPLVIDGRRIYDQKIYSDQINLISIGLRD